MYLIVYAVAYRGAFASDLTARVCEFSLRKICVVGDKMTSSFFKNFIDRSVDLLN